MHFYLGKEILWWAESFIHFLLDEIVIWLSFYKQITMTKFYLLNGTSTLRANQNDKQRYSIYLTPFTFRSVHGWPPNPIRLWYMSEAWKSEVWRGAEGYDLKISCLNALKIQNFYFLKWFLGFCTNELFALFLRWK